VGNCRIDGTRFGSDPRSIQEIAQESRSMHIPVSPGGGSDTVAPAAPASPSTPVATAPAPAPALPRLRPCSGARPCSQDDDDRFVPVDRHGANPGRLARFRDRHAGATDETPSASGDGTGAFRTVCEFSHMAFDDPIVYPGQPGKSHLHVFFGNTGTNANSTAASIANTGNSTCRGGTINRSGYWAPAMIDTLDGTPVTPQSMIIYYKTGYNGVKPGDIKSLPQG
jgi:hypothetical protein